MPSFFLILIRMLGLNPVLFKLQLLRWLFSFFFYLSFGVCQGPRSEKVVGQGPLVQKEGHSCPQTLSATFRTEEEELAK